MGQFQSFQRNFRRKNKNPIVRTEGEDGNGGQEKLLDDFRVMLRIKDE